MEYGPVKKTTVRGHSVYKVFGVLHKCKIIRSFTNTLQKVDFMQKKWIQWPHVLIFSTRGRLRIIENELNIAYFSCDIYLCWAYFCKILKTVTSTKRYSHIFQQILLNSMLVYTCYESLQTRLNSLFLSLVYLQLKKYHFHCLNKSCTSSLYQLRKNSIGI